MFVRRIDHFTIQTEKLTETRNFFVELLNINEGHRPPFLFEGYWLYLDNQPIIHLIEAGYSADDEVAKYLGLRPGVKTGSGAFDHIAFRLEGYGSLLAKLKRLGWDFFERTVPDAKEHQVFVRDPNDITVELIFSDEEFLSWQQQVHIHQ